MKLLDTVVIVGALNPDEKRHKKASAHLNDLTEDATVVIPGSTMIEFDLLMKIRNYADEERTTTWLEISPKIPSRKILSHTTVDLMKASELQKEGMTYFDSLITALALERKGVVITDDKAIASRVATEW